MTPPATLSHPLILSLSKDYLTSGATLPLILRHRRTSAPASAQAEEPKPQPFGGHGPDKPPSGTPLPRPHTSFPFVVSVAEPRTDHAAQLRPPTTHPLILWHRTTSAPASAQPEESKPQPFGGHPHA